MIKKSECLPGFPYFYAAYIFLRVNESINIILVCILVSSSKSMFVNCAIDEIEYAGFGDDDD